jgi:hypothetical protein
MTKQERETAGDFGYDMAHEDMTHDDRAPEETHDNMAAGQADRASAPPDTEHQRYTTVHPGGTSDRGEDYGYDEAHGF